MMNAWLRRLILYVTWFTIFLQWLNIFCYWSIICINYIWLYVCECFAWLHICVPYLCLVPAEVRKEVSSLQLRLQKFERPCGCVGLHTGSLEERSVCLTAELSLLPLFPFKPITLRPLKMRRIYINNISKPLTSPAYKIVFNNRNSIFKAGCKVLC